MDELQAGVEQPLAVLPQPPVLVQPGKAALDDPALGHDREGAQLLARALQEAAGHIRHCAQCHTFTEDEVCETCRDPDRDASRLCVVETPADQSAVERTGAFRGLYFVLMGKLSPLDGIGPREIGL